MTESSTLYAKPSFWTGFARILDFGSTLNEYNCSNTPEEADYKALRRDFAIVANDINNAIYIWETKQNVGEKLSIKKQKRSKR